jgi:oxaloacetate decarboxylase (Na+ extruding) subunit alpha
MHQTPGGMMSNFRSQLETAGLSDRFDELMHEVARVRSELAFPIMITPFAQFVGTQAVMNVISGDRYSVVPNEIKKYVLGYYGELLAPIESELRARIIANGASSIAVEPAPIEPMLPDLRERYPNESIEMLLLRAMFAGTQVDEMKRTVAAGGNPEEISSPVLGLIKGLYEKSSSGKQSLKAGSLQISIEKGKSENVA